MTVTVILREKEYEADDLARIATCFVDGHKLDLLVMAPWTADEANELIARARAVAEKMRLKPLTS